MSFFYLRKLCSLDQKLVSQILNIVSKHLVGIWRDLERDEQALRKTFKHFVMFCYMLVQQKLFY